MPRVIDTAVFQPYICEHKCPVSLILTLITCRGQVQGSERRQLTGGQRIRAGKRHGAA